jgi:hypothetical protein
MTESSNEPALPPAHGSEEADQLEAKRPRRKWKPSGSPGDRAKAAIVKKGGTITTL